MKNIEGIPDHGSDEEPEPMPELGEVPLGPKSEINPNINIVNNIEIDKIDKSGELGKLDEDELPGSKKPEDGSKHYDA